MNKLKFIFYIALIALLMTTISCEKDSEEYNEIEKVSPVQADLSLVPNQKLTDYNFFDGEIKNLNPVYGLIPYKPTSELFSDYAQKKRFIWLPQKHKSNLSGRC